MHAEQTAEEHFPSSVIDIRTPWRVVSVQALENFKLAVVFVDGLQGEVEMSALIHSSHAGVFARLADVQQFQQVFVEYGAVAWPGDLDLAPDALHTTISQYGKAVLA